MVDNQALVLLKLRRTIMIIPKEIVEMKGPLRMVPVRPVGRGREGRGVKGAERAR
jgi:hypothetical protein